MTDWKTVKPIDVRKIHVRFEGDVNTYWDVTLKDGTSMEFYGYESGPHYGSAEHPNCDGSLWDDNAELYDWLVDVVNLEIPHFDPSKEAVDFDLAFTSIARVVTNVEVQHSNTTDDDEGFTVNDVATSHPGIFIFNPLGEAT